MTEVFFNEDEGSGEKLINQAMKAAMEQDSPDDMIYEFFSVVGNCFNCDRVFVYEASHDDSAAYVVEWNKENFSSCKSYIESLSDDYLNLIYNNFEHDNFIYLKNIALIQQSFPEAYEILASQNISSAFLHPLIVKGELIGFYCFENFGSVDLLSVYDFLEMFGIFLISLLKIKNSFLQLHSLSEHDSMTGLYNRGRGEHKIATMVNNGMEGMFLMMDGNHFKSINDTYGHAVGDKVIKAFAQVLHEVFDSIGIPMRLGGDEFAVFVPAFTSEKDAAYLMQNLEDAIAAIDIPELNGNKISASIGVAFKTDNDNISFEQLYKRADDSVYLSKKIPGTPVTFFKD